MATDEHRDQANNAYRAFLLRAWAEDEQGDHRWRFQLESPQQRAVQHFPDLEGLVVYLMQELEIELNLRGDI